MNHALYPPTRLTAPSHTVSAEGIDALGGFDVFYEPRRPPSQ